MKMAPPPRPVPHSTRSPATPSRRTASSDASRWSSWALAHRRVRQERRSGGVVGPGGREALALELAVGLLGVAHRVAQLDRRAGRVVPALGGEQRQPDLVLEVVPVEQRVLEEGEVAADRAIGPGLPLEVVGVLEDHGPQPRGLGDLEQLVAALAALEPVEGRSSSGCAASRSSSTTMARPK